jgi:hydrogenase nickel incorporation protein HypB
MQPQSENEDVDVRPASGVCNMSNDSPYAPKSSLDHRPVLSRDPSLLVVGLVGPPGAGKTSLIEATARQLRGKLNLGIMTAVPAAQRDADRVSRYCDQVVPLSTLHPDFDVILKALPNLKLAELDLLIVETVAPLGGVGHIGEDVTVAVLSVGAGGDKVPLYADLVRHSSALILNKIDLHRHVQFDRSMFRRDIYALNPELEIIDVSTFEKKGIDRWLGWLDRRRREKQSSQDNLDSVPPEVFVG